MGVCIGGDKAWRVYRQGDVGIAYHWINGEPAMCLFPVHRAIANAGAYVIPIESAFQYVHSDGHPNIDKFKQAGADAARVMGFDPTDKFIRRRIIDAIADGMPDLIAMPPEPEDAVEKAVKEVVGEATIKEGGRVIAEKEITTLDQQELASLH